MAVGNIAYSLLPLRRGDVVNNLLSTAADLPLSALQGKGLNDRLAQIGNYLDAHGYTKKKVLPNTDFNRLCPPEYEDGLYMIHGENGPEVGWHYVYLRNFYTCVLQIAVNANATYPVIKMRAYITDRWYEWLRADAKEETYREKYGKVLAGTVGTINSTYDEYSLKLNDDTHYTFACKHGASHPVLGGGEFYVEGYKTNSEYEWQKLTKCEAAETAVFYRSKIDGVWDGFRRMAFV